MDGYLTCYLWPCAVVRPFQLWCAVRNACSWQSGVISQSFTPQPIQGLLTLSLLRVINVKFPLQPQQKYYHTVWRTWLFIAYSQMKDYYTTNPCYLTYTFSLYKVGRMYFVSSGVKGLKVMSDSPRLVDFQVGQADVSGYLPNGQAWLKFFLVCWLNLGLVIVTDKWNWSAGCLKAKLGFWFCQAQQYGHTVNATSIVL